MQDYSLVNSPHFRNLAAILLGMTFSMMIVGLVEMLGHTLFPPPVAIDWEDPAQIRDYLEQVPVGAILMVILAWSLGIFAGSLFAGVIGGEQGTFCCQFLGLMFGSMVLFMVYHLPSPIWFPFTSVACVIASGWSGWRLARNTYNRWQRLYPAEKTDAESNSFT